MNVSELIAQFRNFTDDKQLPYLWGDDEVLLYINEAEKEAARRSRCLTDSLDPDICRINVTAGEATYKLDKRILYVRRIRTNAHNDTLAPCRIALLEQHDNNWETGQGRVEYYITDLNSRSITLYMVPKVNQQLRMTVVRLPISKMVNDNDEPEIPEQYHLAMLNYVYFLAYSKQDPEAKSDERAAKFYQMFESEFGVKYLSSAIHEEFEGENSIIFNDGRF